MPGGDLKRLMGAINRVGVAAATGSFDESTMDEMGEVLRIGLGIPDKDFEGLRTDLAELIEAFHGVVRATGLEAVVERALGEAMRRAAAPRLPATPGTTSSPTPSP